MRRPVAVALGAVIGAVLGALVAGGGVLLLQRPAPVVDPVQRFLDALGDGAIERAAQELTPGFRQAVPPDALREFLVEVGIGPRAASTLDGYRVRGNDGEAFALVTPSPGAPVAVKLGLTGDEGEWRIASIRVHPGVAAGSDLSTRFGPPSLPQVLGLVRATTRHFAEAVAARDLSLFLSGTGRALRERFSTEQFEQAFGGFVEQDIKLEILERFDPVLSSPPLLNDAEVLTVSGFFPTRPSQVRFRYEFTYRHVAWQLVGIQLDVGPPDA